MQRAAGDKPLERSLGRVGIAGGALSARIAVAGKLSAVDASEADASAVLTTQSVAVVHIGDEADEGGEDHLRTLARSYRSTPAPKGNVPPRLDRLHFTAMRSARDLVFGYDGELTMRQIVGKVHEAALLLREAGWADRHIGEALGFSLPTVGKWRRSQGIASLKGRVDYVKVRQLYESGSGDCEIARELGIDQSCVTRWRNGLGLPGNKQKGNAVAADLRRKGKALLRKGQSRKQVAEELGVSLGSVAKLRQEIGDEPALRKAGRTVHDDVRRARKLDPAGLDARIRAAVGRWLAPDLIDDVVNDMHLAIFTGELMPNEIESRAKEFRGQTIGTYASPFRTVSLDENADGWSLIDSIKDEGAEAMIEDAAAAVFEQPD